MDTSHWPQEIVVKPIEEIISNVYKKPQNQQNQLTPSDSEQRKPTTATTKQPQQKGQQVINCPRCNSTNTKFCYYNNYSLTQPRYFCKTCRRYWTEGGSLRNIPVGGATRKNSNNKRHNSSSTSSNSSSPSKKLHISSVSLEHHPHPHPHAKLVQNQNHGQDLNLTFPSSQHFRSIGEFSQLSTIDQNNVKGGDNNGGASNTSVSAMELLNGMQDSRGFSTFIPMPNLDTINTIYSSGYHSNMSNLSNLHEFKPSLNFSLDHHNHNGYNGNFQDHHQGPGNGGGGGGRSLFPFEDLKQVSSATATNVSGVEQINNNRGGGNVDSSGGYWSGMLGGGSW